MTMFTRILDRCGGDRRRRRPGRCSVPVPRARARAATGARPARLRLLSATAWLWTAGYGQPGYGQQGYGYNQQDSLGQIVGQLLGNRYNVNDRTAVQQCASAAMAQASAQYRPQNGYGQPPYGNAYGYNNNRGYQQGYVPPMRVTAITSVERRNNGVRVSGLLDSRAGYPPNGQAYGYQNNGYAATGDLSFRCNVDYRGAVSNVRIRRANTYRG